MRSDAGSSVPTESGRFREASDQTAQGDTTLVTTQFVTARDDSAHGNVDETHFEGHKFEMSVFFFPFQSQQNIAAE